MIQPSCVSLTELDLCHQPAFPNIFYHTMQSYVLQVFEIVATTAAERRLRTARSRQGSNMRKKGAVALANIFCWAAALLYAQMASKSVTFSMPFFINAVHSSRFQYRLDTFCASHRHVPEVISGVQLPAHIHADLLIVPDDRLRIFLHGFQYRMLRLRLGIP